MKPAEGKAKEFMEYLVKGDHPVLKRPDKRFKCETFARAYAAELIQYGYENVTVESTNVIMNTKSV